MKDQRPPRVIRHLFKVYNADEFWAEVLNEGDPMGKYLRRFNAHIPSNPRCSICYSPFGGLGGALSHLGLFWSPRSTKNPRFCTACDTFTGKNPGGAEVELTMLFVDVRGSTTIAEQMPALEFSRLMNRFYDATIRVLVESNAFIDKLVGDEVTALFIPGYTGKQHAQHAIQAGQELLRVTGYGSASGPWIPVGVGIHTGIAWVGSIVGASGEGSDFTALGDNVNIAARLASNAGPGEVLVSEAASRSAHLQIEGLEKRELELKGKSEPVSVVVLTTNKLEA